MRCIGYRRCMMKIINRKNFFPVVCVVFTVLVLLKILLEAIVQKVFGGYQENLLLMFFLSFLTVFILSQHYRLQNFPLLVVILLQYFLLIGTVMLLIWVSSFFEPLHENGYRDMFISFTIPYVIGAVVYYVSLFYEIRRANQALKNIRRYKSENEKSDENR